MEIQTKTKTERQEVIIITDTIVSIKIMNSEIKTQYVLGVALLNKAISDFMALASSDGNTYETRPNNLQQ
jgi:hypothetical protein